VPITTNVVSSNPAQARRPQYNIMWSSLSVTYDRSGFSWGTPVVSYTNKTDRHNITELLVKMALNTINQTYLDV
jgi:hypothetical protein